MKGDFSRQTADPKKHYSGVLMQQGRVQLDADWNEQLAISQHRVQTEAQDVIGPGAAPLAGGGFAISFTQDISDLTISPGRMYVDGILCELEATSISIPVSNFPQEGMSVQVPVWSVDDREFEAGQWVEISASVGGKPDTRLVQINTVDPANMILAFREDISEFQKADAPASLRRITSYITQPDYPILQPDTPGPDYSYTTVSSSTNLAILDFSTLPQDSIVLVYLDVWQRHVTWLDDPHIREVALNGADTTTRVQVVQQVKILPVAIKEGSTATCSTDFPEWDALIAPSTGTLNAQTTTPTSTSSVCLPPSSAGYQRLDNQLYRVEIHQGGDTGNKQDQITFKASRDNGSVVVAIDSFSGNDIIVKEVGLDDVLGFANADGQTIWGEIVDDVTELHGRLGQLVQIKHVEPLTRTITVDPAPTPITPTDKPLHLELRRWDLVGTVTSNWQDLEGGIQLQFSPGIYKTGDYWLIPARTTTGQIEWPQDSNGRFIPQSPLGIKHHYCCLAQLEPPVKLPFWSVQDCRRSFPSLTSPLAMHITNTNWKNDDFFTSDTLIDDGLQMTLDTIIGAVSSAVPSINPAAIFVSLELPVETFPRGSVDININGSAKVTENTVAGSTITWTWDNMDKGTLTQELLGLINTFQALRMPRAPYMRARVKGHVVSSQQGDQSVYLDGQAFGRPDVRSDLMKTPRTALTFPTGAGVAASDFESWFPLVPTPLRITTIEFLDTITQPPTESTLGPIPLPLAPTQSVIIPVQFDNQGKEVFMNAIDITFNRSVNTANLLNQLTLFYTFFGFFELAQARRPSTGATPFTRAPVRPFGGEFFRVQGTVEVVDSTTVRFTITSPIIQGAQSVFIPGSYALTVFGTSTTNPPVTAVTAQDDGAALDGDFDFLPGGDFILNFDVSSPGFFFAPPGSQFG
jgi:Family of unknown function (DUF6519)